MQPIEFAKKVLEAESQAILHTKEFIDEVFVKTAELIAKLEGKLIITGIGKSGHIGRKLSATFSSLGTPSFFIHPSEASHGDLGMIENKDIVLAISYSGNNGDLGDLINFCRKRQIPLVGITGNKESFLAKSSNYCLLAPVEKEADQLGLAPTASTTAHLALGDALALTVADSKGFQREHFAEYHPGGALGKRLAKVDQFMHSGKSVPMVGPEENILEVVKVMTSQEVVGVCGVVENNKLVGVVTDGDIRRRLTKKDFSINLCAHEFMTKNPITIDPSCLAEEAYRLMDSKKIQFLFVLDEHQTPLGAVRLHDLLF